MTDVSTPDSGTDHFRRRRDESTPDPSRWTPTPDPTVLTTAQLHREILALRDLMAANLEGMGDTLAERFLKVEQQFGLVERQRVEQKKDAKDALDAALSAQKEAAKESALASDKAFAKTELSTTNQLSQLGNTFSAAIKGVTDSIDDMKDRVGKTMARGDVEALIGSLRDQGDRDYRAVQESITRLSNNDHSRDGVSVGAAVEQHNADRNRSLVFAVIAAIGLVVSLYLGVRRPTTISVPTPATQTATTVAP